MATVTYFDTLSSGMKAKLEPNYRLSAKQKPACVLSVPRTSEDSPGSHPTFRYPKIRTTFK